ncbi:MurR/RpiR family transcriptional regulator [Helcococcus massiliensis]|uniref:MurR/RpiR family transcriptional regulator n=1 Tax=Helcococcus massiliensis TaxID=2040290 RepID=UPI000CDF0324|nr:MurR/RpiR family transcriptional regulator [Helcococcus massiliensis]
MMNINEMDIIKQLTSIINNNRSDNTDWILANYILENIPNINKINIMDMSEACFVSRATIRRFTIKLGYENFYDFKNRISNMFAYKNVSYKKDNSFFYEDFDIIYQKVCSMFKLILKEFNNDIIDDIVNKIYKSNKFIILSSGKIYGVLKQFQEEFIICGKNVLLKSRIDDNFLFKNLTQDDYIIIISSSGKYLELLSNDLENYKFDYDVVTINKDIEQSFNINTENFDQVDIDIFNKYGITFIFDLILNEYRKLYESINK